MADYFTKDTDRALEAFIFSEDAEEKKKIFTEDISPAFQKLIENLIYVYRFFNIDDLETIKREALSNLYEMIPKFDPTKGTKGFSYFNVVARNWFIQKAKEKKKRQRQENELHVDVDHESTSTDPNFIVKPYEDLAIDRERSLILAESMESWRGRVSKDIDQKVLEAVIFLFKNPDMPTIFNRKAIYLYLRDMTGLSTKQVVTSLKKLRGFYEEFRKDYDEVGDLPDDQEEEDYQ